MKKLSKLRLKDFHEMSDTEMKHVLGGSGSFEGGGTGNIEGGGSGVETTTCSTVCPDGTTIEITHCFGSCVAMDENSVGCQNNAGVTITKSCGY